MQKGRNKLKRPDSCSKEDEELAYFCESVSFDEISFETWSQSHTQLDLVIFLTLTFEQAAKSGCHELKYRQTVLEKCPKTGIITKQFRKITTLVSWTSQLQAGDILVLPDKGDCFDQHKGALHVHLRISP